MPKPKIHFEHRSSSLLAFTIYKAVADWIAYALRKLSVTYADHLFTHVHRCNEGVTHCMSNVLMYRWALLQNQVDFCNAT